ncbi:thiamine pyrophosphate-dependent dehydrogenase E1 component subunit alpha [Frankia sp. CcWB3]
MSSESLIEMQRRMLRIRHFDERAIELQAKGLLPGWLHTSIGHEAAAVGACMALRGDDYMIGYHRSHGHLIGKGSQLGPLMAELLGKSAGVCRGKGGSLHLTDFSVGSLGESGIVGGSLPIAVGAGLSAKMRETGQVCLSFFGDGTANAGPFHEALNLAAIWAVPTVFLCENNGYAVTSPIQEAMAVENVADRAAAYAMPGACVDGQDVLAVYAAVSAAAARARSGGGPSLVDAKTYRFREHVEVVDSQGSLPRYRSPEEVEEWRARDPIVLFREELRSRGVLTGEDAVHLEAEVAREMEGAILFAQESPLPEPGEAFEDVFVNPIAIRSR